MDNQPQMPNISQILDALDRSIKEKEFQAQQRASSSLINSLPNLMGSSFSQIGDKIKQGQDLAKSVWGNVQKEAHENPWGLMAKVAVCGFAVGYLLGRKNIQSRGRK